MPALFTRMSEPAQLGGGLVDRGDDRGRVSRIGLYREARRPIDLISSTTALALSGDDEK